MPSCLWKLQLARYLTLQIVCMKDNLDPKVYRGPDLCSSILMQLEVELEFVYHQLRYNKSMQRNIKTLRSMEKAVNNRTRIYEGI